MSGVERAPEIDDRRIPSVQVVLYQEVGKMTVTRWIWRLVSFCSFSEEEDTKWLRLWRAERQDSCGICSLIDTVRCDNGFNCLCIVALTDVMSINKSFIVSVIFITCITLHSSYHTRTPNFFDVLGSTETRLYSKM